MFDPAPERQSSASTEAHVTFQIDEAALYAVRGIEPSALIPPGGNDSFLRFQYARTPEFEAAHDEWTSSGTVNLDLHAFIRERKRLYSLTRRLASRDGAR